MPLLISFCRLSSPGAPALRAALGYENIASGASSAARAAGETGVYAVCLNTEAVPGRIAWGTTPDATLAAATSASTAGVPIGPGDTQYVNIEGGEKIAFSATV